MGSFRKYSILFSIMIRLYYIFMSLFLHVIIAWVMVPKTIWHVTCVRKVHNNERSDYRNAQEQTIHNNKRSGYGNAQE